jgi:hypothetical protein
MSEEHRDRALAVHVKGHFATMPHAAACWRSPSVSNETVRASIVNTASPQRLFGRNAPEVTELGFGIEMAQSTTTRPSRPLSGSR